MKIAVLGGSFNPPHLGHVLIIDQVLKYADIDEIWLAPCYRHTFEKKLESVSLRVSMTKMLTNGRVKYCGEEVKNKLSGETIELMMLLKNKYPKYQFSFLIGSDNLAGLKKWGQWEKLVTDFQFLIFKRPSYSMNLSEFDLNNPRYKLKFVNHPKLITSTISSTEVRERLKNNLTIVDLVPKNVAKYILKKNLYR